MSVATLKAPIHEQSRSKHAVERFRSDPAYQAFVLLRVGFTALPIVGHRQVLQHAGQLGALSSSVDP
jgi:hypothetical protein